MAFEDEDDGAEASSLRAAKTEPTPEDKWVGHRITLRRVELGYSRQRLADELGISRQQLDKMERGDNRITCGRLFAIAVALGTAPGWFFDRYPGAETARLIAPTEDIASLLTPEVAEFVRRFAKLTREQRHAITVTLEGFEGANAAIQEAAAADE